MIYQLAAIEMKTIGFIFLWILSLPGFGQKKSNTISDQIIGSATLIHKAADEKFDRWELLFHDVNHKKEVLWLLAKSRKDKKLISATYQIKRKPFDVMDTKNLLGLVYDQEKEYPVRSGKVNLQVSASLIKLSADLKLSQLGKKKYYYQGKYKIIDVH